MSSQKQSTSDFEGADLHFLNPFVFNAPFLYPLKTDFFSEGRERGQWKRMG